MNKRSLIVMMLIGLLGFGMMSLVGCPTDSGSDGGEKKDDTTEKVVAEKYRGTWVLENNNTVKITLTENTFTKTDVTKGPYTAWTEEADLWLSNGTNKGKLGTFQSDDTALLNGSAGFTFSYISGTYKKQP